MPATRWTPNNGFGSLVPKNITQKDLAALYLGHVSSLILRLIGHSFSVSAGIRSVAISAYTQRNASTGRIDDEYVAVVEIDRNGWNQVDCSEMSSIDRSEEHTSELQSLMRISYAVFCLKTK